MGGMDATGFRDLVRRAQAGDPAAVDRLLAVIRPHLERLAARYADPARAAESTSDLVQEAWLRAWRKLDQFRGTDADDEQALAAFLTWVGKLLRHVGQNRQRDAHRQRRRPSQPLVSLDGAVPGGSTCPGKAVEPAAPQPTPSANVRANEQARFVLEALAELPDDKDREIVRLCFFEQLSLRQIAERLQLGYDDVRRRFRGSLRRLGDRLEGLR
jgi:RNA polymerase sigma-70 factor (ECF subfamily)